MSVCSFSFLLLGGEGKGTDSLLDNIMALDTRWVEYIQVFLNCRLLLLESLQFLVELAWTV